MTDITDQDKREARRLAEDIQKFPERYGSHWHAMARIVLAAVPAPTLEEELRQLADEYKDENHPELSELFGRLAVRAQQIEQDLNNAVARADRGWTEVDRLIKIATQTTLNLLNRRVAEATRAAETAVAEYLDDIDEAHSYDDVHYDEAHVDAEIDYLYEKIMYDQLGENWEELVSFVTVGAAS